MGFLADTLFLVALLLFVYGLAGIVNPLWIKDYKTGAVPSRLDALLVAVSIPQVFTFLGGLLLAEGQKHAMQAFLGVSFVVLGGLGFYLWGMLGALRHMALSWKLGEFSSRLLAGVLAVVPGFGFVCLTVGLNVSNNVGFSWGGQVFLCILGWGMVYGFKEFFKIPFLPHLNRAAATQNHHPVSEPEVPLAQSRPLAVNKPLSPAPVAPVRQPESTETFSFAYAEDDGQVSQIKAYALAAGQDRYDKRYLSGVCHPASERRIFWLSRVLGSVTQDTTGQQWEPQTVFDSLDPIVAPGRL